MVHLFSRALVVGHYLRLQDPRIRPFYYDLLERPYGAYRYLPRSWYRPLLGWRMHARSPYALMFGADENGARAMLDYGRHVPCKKIYYSLHIREYRNPARPEAEVTGGPKLAGACDWVITQDEDRGALLREHYGIGLDMIRYLPGAPLGEPARTPGFYFHDLLGIERGKRIALFAGSYSDGLGLDLILPSIASWPSNWVCVLHIPCSEARNDERDLGLKLMRVLLPGDRCYLSTRPIEPADMRRAMDSVDAAFVFYTCSPRIASTYMNNRKSGHSSGKLSMALRSGIPVVVNGYTNLPDIVKRNGCGVVIDGPGDIPAALEEIDRGFDSFSRGAIRAFQEEFDFRKAYESMPWPHAGK